MPRKCPAAFLARIILSHQEVAGVPKTKIYPKPLPIAKRLRPPNECEVRHDKTGLSPAATVRAAF